MRLVLFAVLLSLTAQAQNPRPREFRSDGAPRTSRLGQTSAGGGGSDSLNTGLERYYSLSGNALDSISGVNGTVAGPSPTYQTGNVSPQALYVGDNALNNFSATPYGAADFSASVWVYRTNSVVTFSAILGNMIGGTTANWVIFGGAGNNLDLYTNGNTSKGAITGNLLLSTWYHIVITRTGSNMITYLNGAQYTTFTVAPGSTGSEICIGRLDGYGAVFFRVQDVGLWSRAITADEVVRLYNSGTGKVPPFN